MVAGIYLQPGTHVFEIFRSVSKLAPSTFYIWFLLCLYSFHRLVGGARKILGESGLELPSEQEWRQEFSHGG